MAISWDVMDAYLHIGAPVTFIWGSSPSSLTNTATANSTTYFSSQVVMHMRVSPGWRSIPLLLLTALSDHRSLLFHHRSIRG